MKRSALALLILTLAFGPAARAEIGFKLPPPELNGLLALAAMPLDKPPVPAPPVPLPKAPGLPDLPTPPLLSDISHRPVAPMPAPRALACNPVGTVFGVTSELVECGRARYQKGELEPARAAFTSAVQGSSDRALLREARYWLGETLIRLGRPVEAQRALSLVSQDDPRGEFAPFAANDLGFIALEQNEPSRALGYFEGLLKGRMPVVLVPSARHGRALALYGLKRYAEARDEWSAVLTGGPNVPRGLSLEATYWMGDTLGRLGDYKGAVARLQTFTGSGSRLLRDNGWLSLGWWSRAAGRPDEAVKAYRRLLASSTDATLALWARAGLVQALLDQDDYAKAREEAKVIEGLDKSGTLALPSLLSLRRYAADKSKADEARALDTDLLGRQLTPATRAWVLLLSADLARQSGNPGEARDRLDLVGATPVEPDVKQQADFRRAQLDFDAREFVQAKASAQALLAPASSSDLRAAAMVLAAESAYWARDYGQAAELYTRFLSDFSGRPEAAYVGLALGWAEFRRGRLDAARQRWIAFANAAPADRRAAETLLLAAELAAKAGDATEARSLLDRVVSQHQGTEQADIAIVNRAILALRAGRPDEALAEINRLGARASSPDLGRARVARGLAQIASKRDAQAEADLKGALGQGDDALCHLGLGVIAFGRGQWDAAAHEFTEARDAGGAGAGAADYGLAAVAFNQGKVEEFKTAADALLARPADPATTPQLLRGMQALAAEDKRWADARTLALRLADQYPRHAVTPAAVADVGAAAGASAEWPLAREMYQILDARYPSSPARRTGRIVYGEALLRTGAAADARRELEAAVSALPPGDPARARALPLLAQAQEAAGDRGAATRTYARFATENPGGKGAPVADLGAGRLLQADGKWSEAQPLLERAVKGGDTDVAAEAAYHMGEGLRAAGQHDDAIESYMTAAYAAPDSIWGRRALVGAGRSFAALKQNDAAVIVYRKVLAASSVEPDLEAAAKTGLKALGAN